MAAGLLGCQRLEERIDSVSSRVDNLENTQIASLKQQLAAMDESVGKLEKTDAELKDYIETLHGTANDLRKSITDNDTKISELEKSLDQAINDAQNSDSALKSELEQQITSAKTDVFSQLAAAKTAMESRLEQIESIISTLQQKDADLEKKIADLKTSMDAQLSGEISSAKDWATATFATLEQYNSIVSDISGIRGSIESLETSLKSLEESLTGRIQTEVADAIAPIKDQLVSEAAAKVVEGYTEAISSVRSEVEEIASRVKTLEDEVKLIKEDVDNIKQDLEEINSKLDSGQPGGIQSIIFVPEYSDGKATMYYSTETDGSFVPGEAALRFEVYPAAMADKLAEAWETSLSVKLLYTMTRAAAGESIDLPIKGASASDGILTVTVSGEKIDDEAFFQKELPASVRLLATTGGVQKASEYIPIHPATSDDAIYVPDAVFKKYLIDNFDVNHDGEFTPIDALAVTSIDVSNKGVSSLVGVEHLSNLVSLNCRNNRIAELDLSGCPSLQELYCDNNQLLSLDLSVCPSLMDLNCSGNRLVNLKLDGCDKLSVMHIGSNADARSGQSIDIKEFNQAAVFELSLKNTPFTSLSFTNSSKVTSLSIDGDFTDMDISGNIGLTSVDVSKNVKLESLDVSNTPLKSLDLTKNTELESLDVSSTPLQSLDLTKNTELKRLMASFLAVTELDLTANARLRVLDLTGNASLSRVVCASQDWLDNLCVFDNHGISFEDRAGRKLRNEGVKIDGVYWAVYNVGASDADLYGGRFTFDDAQNACPEGWRTPAMSELDFLSMNYSQVTIFNGMKGRWFSGIQIYSFSVPVIFLPYRGGASNGAYWSSTVDDSNYAYGLNFDKTDVHVESYDRPFSYSVRCVKK